MLLRCQSGLPYIWQPLLIVAAVGSVATAQSAARHGEVRGVAVDTAGAPVAGVEVFAPGTGWRAVTTERGQFRLTRLDPGRYQLVARRTGFGPESLSVMLAEGETKELRIVLRPIATELEEIVVRDEPALPPRFDDFERRRKNRMGGHYVTKADIDRQKPRVTSDILRRVLGLKIVDSMGVPLAVSARGPKTSLMGGRPVPVHCVLRVGVDGNVKEPYFAVNSIPPQDIHGIEVHHSASMPSEFGGARRDAFCGLIMIWTRAH
jgi:hypothetical protein